VDGKEKVLVGEMGAIEVKEDLYLLINKFKFTVS